MGRREWMNKMSRHHTMPKKFRNGDAEVKMVTERDHRLWHALTDTKDGQAQHPINAMRELAIKFLPKEMEAEFMREVTK